MKILSLAQTEEEINKVKRLAERLDLAIIEEPSEEEQKELMLRYDAEGLSLVEGELSMRGDFTKMHKRLKLANLRGELLVRAAKIKGIEGEPTAIDATAGMGEDGMLLAAAGFHIKLYEYNPIIHALLEDALERAAKEPELAEIVARMELFQENSIEAIRSISTPPDVVLLDPMFPARQKSGLVKKKFQLIQHLEHPCSDADELMGAVMAVHPKKIIVKRPAKGPYLADVKPNYSIEGKGIRYDCITMG